MFAVKKKRFSVKQIVGVLKQAEVGVPIGELVRQVGISKQTLYRWKKRYAKLKIDQVRQRKQWQEVNLRLKRLVAELSLEKQATGRVETAGSPFNFFVFSTLLPFLSLRKTVS